jgi:predicted NBD/HSP70 family sugar kinase/biotin operon repressor
LDSEAIMSSHTGNAINMKRNNQKAILNHLFYNSMSRPDLAKELRLTRAALSLHADELMASGLVVEKGAGESETGRKPMLLDINAKYGHVGCLYMSRSDWAMAVTDLKGNISESVIMPLPTGFPPDMAMEEFSRQWSILLEASGVDSKSLLSFSASVPGPVDTSKGVMLTPPGLERWNHFPLKDELGKFAGVDVFVENNAASLALAELRFGFGRACRNFLYIVVDSGIGGGMIIDGQLFKGSGGFSAEIGHTSIDMNGRRCACGNVGCLERYACMPALLGDMFSPEEGIRTWRQVVEAAKDGSRRCRDVMEREADYLACALVNYVNLLEPEAIVFGGDLLCQPEMIAKLIQERTGKRAIMRGGRHVAVLPSELKGDAHILAAATIGINEFFN